MGMNAGLTRLAQVIDWMCIALAALITLGMLGAYVFGSPSSDAAFFFIGPVLIVVFGKAVRYIINGFAS